MTYLLIAYKKISNVARMGAQPFIMSTDCKYQPTCSEYCHDALHHYGPLKGTLKSVWRVIRCNPFSKGGVDLA